MLGLNEPLELAIQSTSAHSSTHRPEQPPDTSKAPPAAQPPSETQLLEDELELDLENMRIEEHIDTSVGERGSDVCSYCFLSAGDSKYCILSYI